MGVSKNKGIPNWMVKIMENPYKQMDDLGCKKNPIFWLETPKYSMFNLWNVKNPGDCQGIDGFYH